MREPLSDVLLLLDYIQNYPYRPCTRCFVIILQHVEFAVDHLCTCQKWNEFNNFQLIQSRVIVFIELCKEWIERLIIFKTLLVLLAHYISDDISALLFVDETFRFDVVLSPHCCQWDLDSWSAHYSLSILFYIWCSRSDIVSVLFELGNFWIGNFKWIFELIQNILVRMLYGHLTGVFFQHFIIFEKKILNNLFKNIILNIFIRGKPLWSLYLRFWMLIRNTRHILD